MLFNKKISEKKKEKKTVPVGKRMDREDKKTREERQNQEEKGKKRGGKRTEKAYGGKG